MASIRKRGDRWHVQIRRKGYPAICRAFTQRKDADTWARDVEGKLDRGEDIAAPLASITVGELIRRYAASVSPTKRGGEVESIRLQAMAKQPVGKVMAGRLTSASLATWRDERLRDVAPATVLRELGLLRRVMVTANHEWGVSVPLTVFDFIKKPRQPAGRVRRLPADAAAALLTACESAHNRYLRPAVLIALETGMRRGEIVALTWADVDLESGLMHVREAKNGHGRFIPLTSPAKKELLRLRALGGERPFSCTGSALHQAFERARERARQALQHQAPGLHATALSRSVDALEGLRFHDLRHEAISRFFEKGLTIVEAAEVSGHRTLSMLKRYAHADIQRISAKFSSTNPTSMST